MFMIVYVAIFFFKDCNYLISDANIAQLYDIDCAIVTQIKF